MTTQPVGNTAPPDQREQTRLAVGAMLISIFFVVGFALCIIGTYHKPDPNGITLGVVGPPAQTAPLRAELQDAVGSAFDIRSVPTIGEAAHDVRQRDLNAAFVPTPTATRPGTIIVASANGRLVATAAEAAARAVTTEQGTQLVVHDVRPLPAGDEIGLGVFMFTIICTICGYLAVSLIYTTSPGLNTNRLYAFIIANAVLVPTLAYLIGGLGFGTYTGSTETILAFLGVAALYTLIVGVITRWFQILLGPPALFVSLAIFVFLNIPSLGATYTGPMLPSFWQFMNHFWIGASTVNAERSILYFQREGLGTDVLKIVAWTSVIATLLVVPIYRKRGHRPQRSPVGPAMTPRAASSHPKS
jgi:hypothetical protein